MSVTRQQAETVLNRIKTQYRAHWEPDERCAPKLVENWDWLESGPRRWAIVWEEGPFEWAFRASMGGFDEEAALLTADHLGEEETRARAKAGRFNVEPIEMPKGTFMECVTSWAVGIYEA